MKAALISMESESSKMTAEAMKKYFDNVDSLNIKKIEIGMGSGKLDVLFEGKILKKYDCIYAKGSFRYAPLLRSITRALFSSTYMPIRPATYTIGHDKLLTHLALQQFKIPMPATYLASSLDSARKILDKVNYPVIMKFPHGTGGKGVMYAESFAAASSILDALTTLRQPFLIQEYIETGGVDIRAIVIGNKVVAAMKRKAEFREKRANIHAGGKGEEFLLDNHMKKIAVDTAKSIGAEICAVDILEGIKGPLVIEANLSPGLQGITEATQVDVADKIAKYLHTRAKEIKEKDTEKGTTEIMQDLAVSKNNGHTQQIISHVDFRANRLLLPKVVTDLTKFNEKDEFVIKAKKGKVSVEKLK